MKRGLAICCAGMATAALLTGCAELAELKETVREYGVTVLQDLTILSGQTGSTDASEPFADPEHSFDYDAVDDYMTTADGRYTIAYVTDGGVLRDGGRNQRSWEGVKRFAAESGRSYKCYPAGHSGNASEAERHEAMKAAIRSGAELVICTGEAQQRTVTQLAAEHPEVGFVYLEGSEQKDFGGSRLENLYPVSFREEELGYLAGYAAVSEGTVQLGVVSAQTDRCRRYETGFLQGAEAAAAQTDAQVQVRIHHDTRPRGGEALQNLLDQWLRDGTELLFVCAEPMQADALAAVSSYGGRVIAPEMEGMPRDALMLGVQRDLRTAAYRACEGFYADRWAENGGSTVTLGAAEQAVSLTAQPWPLQRFTRQAYETLLSQLGNGTVAVGENPDEFSAPEALPHLTRTEEE